MQNGKLQPLRRLDQILWCSEEMSIQTVAKLLPKSLNLQFLVTQRPSTLPPV